MIKQKNSGKHKGQWLVRIQPVNKITGKRESWPIQYAKTKKQAKLLEAKMWADYQEGFNQADGNAIFAEEFKKFVEHKKKAVSPVTFRDWEYSSKIIKQYFGSAKIAQITSQTIADFAQAFVHDRNLKVGKSTVIDHRLNHIKSYFQSIVGTVVRVNPVPDKALEVFFRQSQFDLRQKRYVFTDEELQAIKNQIIDDLRGSHVTRWLTRLAIWIDLETGMRPGEIQALRFNNLVFSKNYKTFEINDSWSDFSKNFNGALKSRPHGSSRECLPISEGLASFIKEFHLKQNEFLAEHGLKNPENLIFLNIRNYKSSADNQPINQRSINEMLIKLCDKLGIQSKNEEKLSLYSFRHTLCTKLANKPGISYPWAAARMGNSLPVFMKVYVNVDRDLNEQMVQKWLA